MLFDSFSCFLKVYPGLMITSGFIHYLLNGLHFTVHIRDVCVFLAPTFRSVVEEALITLSFV